MRRFLDVAARDRLFGAWLLSPAGLRRSEVVGLEWDAVDLDAGTLEIRQGRVALGRESVVDEPKSDASGRTLPLDAETVDALAALKLRQKTERLAAGPAYDGTSGYVVVDELGRPYRPERYSDLFRELNVAAGVKMITLHEVRHTCGTSCISAAYRPP